MALGSQLAAIRRILAGLFAPPGAGTLALSSDARSQSIRSASCKRCRQTWWRRFQTPAFCQSRKRRQHVMPLPQPSSWGNISHGITLFKTKTMPVSAARFAMLLGRPPLGLGGSGGKSGAMIVHNASLINGVLMGPIYHTASILLGALSAERGAFRQAIAAEICEGACALTVVAPHVRVWIRRANSLHASCCAAGFPEQARELAQMNEIADRPRGRV
jgi:hypothetical protein